MAISTGILDWAISTPNPRLLGILMAIFCQGPLFSGEQDVLDFETLGSFLEDFKSWFLQIKDLFLDFGGFVCLQKMGG